MVTYLDTTRIIDKKHTDAPLNRSRTGYGGKVPTTWLLRLDNKRWHRVYVRIWSNVGSAYILIQGQRHCLGPYDPNDPCTASEAA